MISFENRLTEVVENEEKLRYADIIRLPLTVPPGAGFSLDVMRKRFRVLDILDAAKADKADTIEMEDADFELMRKTFTEFSGWKFMHKEILAIDEYLQAAKHGKG